MKYQAGFVLMELVISLALLSLVAGALCGTLGQLTRMHNELQKRVLALQTTTNQHELAMVKGGEHEL